MLAKGATEKKLKKITLIRHGALGVKYKGAFVGATDLPLSTLGTQQAQALASRLTIDPHTLIYSSPKKRAQKTASILIGGDVSRLDVESNLREIDFGRWECLHFQEIPLADKHLVKEWYCNANAFCFPEGESVLSFIRRISMFKEKLITKMNDVIIVAHGGVISVLICLLLGISTDHHIAFKISYGSVTTIEIDGDIGRLTCMNDQSHLEGIKL